jgi:hypothetical protein
MFRTMCSRVLVCAVLVVRALAHGTTAELQVSQFWQRGEIGAAMPAETQERFPDLVQWLPSTHMPAGILLASRRYPLPWAGRGFCEQPAQSPGTEKCGSNASPREYFRTGAYIHASMTQDHVVRVHDQKDAPPLLSHIVVIELHTAMAEWVFRLSLVHARARRRWREEELTTGAEASLGEHGAGGEGLGAGRHGEDESSTREHGIRLDGNPWQAEIAYFLPTLGTDARPAVLIFQHMYTIQKRT